jgi:hypothetical protein
LFLSLTENSNAGSEEWRAYVKFGIPLKKKVVTIQEQLVQAMGDGEPSCDSVRRWANRFQDGVESFENQPRPGRPTTSRTSSNIAGPMHSTVPRSACFQKNYPNPEFTPSTQSVGLVGALKSTTSFVAFYFPILSGFLTECRMNPAHASLLLLRAGDIEQNPGPCTT